MWNVSNTYMRTMFMCARSMHTMEYAKNELNRLWQVLGWNDRHMPTKEEVIELCRVEFGAFIDRSVIFAGRFLRQVDQIRMNHWNARNRDWVLHFEDILSPTDEPLRRRMLDLYNDPDVSGLITRLDTGDREDRVSLMHHYVFRVAFPDPESEMDSDIEIDSDSEDELPIVNPNEADDAAGPVIHRILDEMVDGV